MDIIIFRSWRFVASSGRPVCAPKVCGMCSGVRFMRNHVFLRRLGLFLVALCEIWGLGATLAGMPDAQICRKSRNFGAGDSGRARGNMQSRQKCAGIPDVIGVKHLRKVYMFASCGCGF